MPMGSVKQLIMRLPARAWAMLRERNFVFSDRGHCLSQSTPVLTGIWPGIKWGIGSALARTLDGAGISS